ncbi:MAG: CocE/NonD family hydrolase [Actinobacteria bacterium]|nr:CocE/NonD family hydrolase [Actinomycetota bacterium]
MSPARPLSLGQPDPHADQAMVGMRDGVRLATDVYLPAGRGPFPTVLTRLPYDKSGRDCFIPWVAAYMTGRGYAFVAQDTRGKGRSEGEPIAFVDELADGYDSLDWVAGRSWCDGGVAMWGESYFGFTQWAAAASGHPALRAIVPRNTTADVAGDWLYRQGVPRLAFPLAWAADTWMDNRMYGIVPADLDWGAGDPAGALGSAHGERRCASLELWRRSPAEAPLWDRMPFRAEHLAAALRIPALHVGGWFDIFRRGQMAAWRSARRSSRAPQPLIMDAVDHAHAGWSLEPSGPIDLHSIASAEIEAFMPEYLDPTLDFYDAVLGGAERPAAPVRWRAGGGEWQSGPTWPPAAAQPLRLDLVDAGNALRHPDGGGLSPRPDPTPTAVDWTHDPGRPVPSLYLDELQALAAPPDDRQLDGRPDLLRFSSDPFPAGLRIAGPVRVRVATTATATSAATTAKLVDVAPDRTTRRLSDGAAAHGADTRPRPVVIDLGDLAHDLAPGHRLRLEFAASSYPQFLPRAAGEGEGWAGDGRAAERTLLVGGSNGSALELTVLPARAEQPR